MKEEKEYNLKKSQETVGQLYPILEAADGEIIDGFHRSQADENWKRIKLDHINTEKKKLIARCVSNWHRRRVTHKEKQEWINGLAEVYKQEGLQVGTSGKPNQIVNQIMKVTGLTRMTVINYIDASYTQKPQGGPKNKPRTLASTVISKLSINHGYDPDELVERHRKELLGTPEFLQEASRKYAETYRNLEVKRQQAAAKIVDLNLEVGSMRFSKKKLGKAFPKGLWWERWLELQRTLGLLSEILATGRLKPQKPKKSGDDKYDALVKAGRNIVWQMRLSYIITFHEVGRKILDSGYKTGKPYKWTASVVNRFCKECAIIRAEFKVAVRLAEILDDDLLAEIKGIYNNLLKRYV